MSKPVTYWEKRFAIAEEHTQAALLAIYESDPERYVDLSKVLSSWVDEVKALVDTGEHYHTHSHGHNHSHTHEPKEVMTSRAQVVAMLQRHLSDQYITDGNPNGFLPKPTIARTPLSLSDYTGVTGTITQAWLTNPTLDVVTLTIKAGHNGIAISENLGMLMYRKGGGVWQVWADTAPIDIDQAEIELMKLVDRYS